MPFLVGPELVEPVTRSLLGAIDVDGGPTDEQLAVLRAVVTYLWERPDLDLARLAPLGPGEAATAIEDQARAPPAQRGAGHARAVPPPRDGDTGRARRGVRGDAMDVGGPHLDICRKWIDEGTERARRTSTASTPRTSPRSPSPRCATGTSGSTSPTPTSPIVSKRSTTSPRTRSAGTTSSSTGATTSPSPAGTRNAGALRQPRHEPRDQRLRADRSGRDRARRVHAGDERQRRQLAAVRRQPRDPRSRAAQARRHRAQGEHDDAAPVRPTSSARGSPAARAARRTSARPTTSPWPTGCSIRCARITTSCRCSTPWSDRASLHAPRGSSCAIPSHGYHGHMTESEYKFLLKGGRELPGPNKLVKGLGTYSLTRRHQEAEYYDTADLRLTRAGASLRFRSDDGWTVKLPERQHRMLEREPDPLFGRFPPTPPVHLGRRSRSSACACLGPPPWTRWRRSPPTGRRFGSSTAADGRSGRSTTIGSGRKRCGTVRRRSTRSKLEVGSDADAQLVDELVARLRKAGAKADGPRPKVARALGEPARAAPDVVPGDRLGRRSTPSDLVQTVLAERFCIGS